MADTIDTRMKHLRSRIPQNATAGLAPDQQSVDLEPLAEPVASEEAARRGFSRRSFLSGLGAAGVLAGAAPLAAAAPALEPALQDQADAGGTGNLTLRINGKDYTLRGLDPRATLLDTLRERIHLTGTKKGCDHGQCGACTVMVGGRRVLSCLTLALTAQDQQITTIEGLSQGDELHPMQQAFIDQDAFQCGYCTPGQIVSAIACVKEGHATSDDDIREYMSGNLCRCAAYPNIVAAVKQAAPAMADEQKG